MGHACLWLNRNDESLTLFLSLADDRAGRAWLEWTETFVKEHDGAPVAHYLRGDALARSGRWVEAIDCYHKALNTRGDFALALNARGVAYAELGWRWPLKS